MLRIQPIRTPLEAQRLLESFDPRTTTWVVSDLKSKLDLNRRLLRESQFVPGTSVLRASELWKSLLTRTRADLQIVSREFVLTLIADRLASFELEWAHAPGVPQTVFDYMTQLMPVLSHPSGEEMMVDWFSRNDASEARWGRWFTLSVRVWQMMLTEGFLAAPWVSGVLVNEGSLSSVWSRPLVIDLGADLTQVEADLLLVLGDHLDVLVLKPEPTWRAEYSRTLQAYDVLEAKVGIGHEPALTEIRAPAKSKNSSVSYRKYTTMIAEVKDATALIRKWLDSESVLPSEIAIVAPDIEAYWYALSNYLEVEGVPCQKDLVRRLHSFPDLAQWLANLRLKTGGYDESDLELAMYAGPDVEKKLISYEKFKTLYSAVYGREDLGRHKSVAHAYQIQLQPDDSALRDEFLIWSLKQLPAVVDLDRVELGLKRVLSECPESLSLPVRRWMAYLEQVFSRIEVRIAAGDPEGVQCLRLSSAENSPAKRMILLGLTESALKKTLATSILFSDLWSLGQEFGFHLASDDQAQLEFETRWLIEAGERDLVLSVPETDFDGAAQAPSWLWVKGSREKGEGDVVTVPSPTRWDEIQKGELASISKERGWTSIETARVETSMAQDFYEEKLPAFAAGVVDSLSPSKIEAYLECPFIFAAKHMFKLADDSELDLEVDPLRRGSLMHAVFEELTSVQPMKFDLSDAELDAVVEKARVESKLELADPRLWGPLKARHIDLGRRFLEFEKQYRSEFSDVRTVAREFSVEGYLQPSTGVLSPESSDGALKFSGRIDRIDSDANDHLALFDYKSSNFGLKQFGSWIKNNKVQLLLYSLAIENGLTALKARPVLAALYYVARPLARETGFMIEGAEQGLYEIKNKRKKNRLALDQKEAFFREGEALIQKAVAGMLAGDFAPNPRDPKKCNDCRWSSLCRTPHLNS
jgi:ATP-dependent helicase/nuclease subunit B